MTLDEAIKSYRTKAKDCFEWENYRMAQEYAQVADWLEELGRSRETIRLLHAEVASNGCGHF